MAGRGRGAVLPAWMQGDTKVPAPGSISINPPSKTTLPPNNTVAAAAPGSSSHPLPHIIPLSPALQWRETTAPDGRSYYYNTLTKESTWKRPHELGSLPPVSLSLSDWRETTAPNGRPYWYNKVTKESRWTPPEGLTVGNISTNTTTSGGGLPSSSSVPPPQQQPPVAPNHMNGVSGRGAMHPPQQPYPAKGGAGRGQFLPPQGGDRGGRGGRGREGRGNMDHQEQSAEAAGFHMMMMPPRGGGRGGSILNTDMMEEEGGGGGEYVPKPGAIKPGPTLMYTSPSDAKAAFKAMLDDADMPTYFSWDQAMRVVSVDHRYMALPSLGEKKQAFGEWMHVRKKEEAEEERMRRRRMKEGFYSMLDGCRELAEWAEDYLDSSSSRYKSSSSSSSKPRYSRAEDLLGSDPRWMAVQSASDREDLFYDWLDDIENKAREKERERRRSKLVAFKQLLKKSTPEYITACTSWRRARDKLADEDEYRDLDKIERLEVYSEYIKELEEKEKEGEEEEKKMEKRRERRARDAFIRLLQQHKARGVFHCRTKWREYLPVVQNEAAYLDMLKNTSGSRPKELFYTLLLLTEEDEAEWQELRRKIMTDGGKGECSSGIEVSADTTFDQYYDMVCDRIGSNSSNGGGNGGDTDDGGKPVSRVVVKLLYLEKMDPYIKAKQKAKNDLMAVFDRYRDQLSGGDMPWEKVVEVLEREEEEGGGGWVGVEGIGGDDERREVYAEYWKTRKEEERERERERESKKERKRRGGGGSDRDSEDEVGAWKRKKGAEEDSESEEGEIPT